MKIANIARAGRVDAGGRFVEHDQLRIVQERLGEPDALQHAFRIAAQPPVARVAQTDEREQFVHLRAQERAVQAGEFSEKAEGLGAA